MPATSTAIHLNGLTIQPGEVVEFDTRTPHWIGNPGPTPAEVLAIFGPQGERMHVRS